MLILIITVSTYANPMVSGEPGLDPVKTLDELSNVVPLNVVGLTVKAVLQTSDEVSSSYLTQNHYDKIFVIDTIAKSIYTKRYDTITDTLRGICSSKEGTFYRHGIGKMVKETINITKIDSIFNKYTFREIRSDTNLIASK